MTYVIPNDRITDPHLRHDFLFLFDVTHGNPNGDPDADNQPRIDQDTGVGLVSDVSIKRKVRDTIAQIKGETERYRIYIQTKGIALNSLLTESQVANTGQEEGVGEKGETEKQVDHRRDPDEIVKRQVYMREHFYDVRLFGAVMSTGDYPAGHVRGPLQLTFANSLDPIFPLDLSITRVAVTKVDPSKPDKITEMGRKMFLPYALYRGHGFFSPAWAKSSGLQDDDGVSSEDLVLFWQAFQEMWDLHRTASSGMQSFYKLYIFTHDSPLGHAHAHQLFQRIQVTRREGIQFPRKREDYIVAVNEEEMPRGITLTKIEA